MAEDCVDVCALGQEVDAAWAIAFDLDAEHPVQFSKVHDLEVLVEAGLEFLDEADGGGSD